MTFVGNGDNNKNDVVAVPELTTLRVSDKDEFYVNLVQYEEEEDSMEEDRCLSEPSTPRIRCHFFCKWIKFFFIFVFVAGLAFVVFKWIAPFLMDKGIIPILNWERSSFSTPVLALIIFTTVALFPTILLPSSPSMWVAGMTFGYGYGFLIIMPAMMIGVSLPYLVGSLFYHKIQGWMEKYPKRASIIRLAGEGGWFDQFRAVALIRVSPFPYIIYNYCAVATNVKYGPYIFGSVLGNVPDVLVAIYTGILIKTLADASGQKHSLSAQEIIMNVVGFAATVATTIICTILAKRRLKTMPIEDEPLLQ
ncbi:hypothetical protein SOVF_216860 [Spinacia oleracea]|uniref:VTT domain-containing protein n=1 Tax=Spinacia oleracea TaxID=3562 RepID=A0A9R0JRK7_SPIOL|nr:uncharacterized protein LOC110784381 [Spinacia oleracea]KNA02632.1 hypothetical protein SOVF_216860 [Spinacia oleracea]